jgi:hypothetical protein
VLSTLLSTTTKQVIYIYKKQPIRNKPMVFPYDDVCRAICISHLSTGKISKVFWKISINLENISKVFCI